MGRISSLGSVSMAAGRPSLYGSPISDNDSKKKLSYVAIEVYVIPIFKAVFPNFLLLASTSFGSVHTELSIVRISHQR